MKRPLKQIFIMFFAISIAIILVDCFLVEKVSCGDEITASRDCSELPSHLDDPNLNHFDDVSCCDSLLQSDKYSICLELVCNPSADLISIYPNCIWQPPKRT